MPSDDSAKNSLPENGKGGGHGFSGKTVSDGRFRLESIIGGGGFGDVYRGLDLQLGGPVAIKLSTGSGVSENAFRREAKLLHSIQHPNVVRVLAYGKADDIGAHFIVMDYLDGTPLEKLLAKGPLSSEQLSELALQIGDALEGVHHQKTAHRDLSANNILQISIPVQPGHTRRVPWRFVLIDFGISAKFDAQKSLGASTTKGYGTPEYMPPEMLQQTNEGELDFNTAVGVDIYAFGIILYRALTGTKPFALKKNSMDGLVQLVSEINNIPAQPPSSICSDPRITPEIDALILSCLAKDPAARPRSPFQVGQDLAHFLSTSSKTGPLPQYSKPGSEKSRVASWIKGLLALAFAGFIVCYFAIPRFHERLDQFLPQHTSEPTKPTFQLHVYPSRPVNLKAGKDEEMIEFWIADSSGLVQALPETGAKELEVVLDEQLRSAVNVSRVPEASLSSGKQQLNISADLNALACQGTLKVSLPDPTGETMTQTVAIEVTPADYWQPAGLPADVRWKNVGTLSPIENYSGVYADEIQIVHPKLPEPVRFRRVFEPSARSSQILPPFYMMIFKVTRRDFKCFLNDDDTPWTPESDDDLYPATNVTVNEAFRYSQWLCGPHGTIPSFSEWVTAAGIWHPSEPTGPYDPKVSKAPITKQLGRIGLDFPMDISRYGIHEMAVNGLELTRTIRSSQALHFPVEDTDTVVVLGSGYDEKSLDENYRMTMKSKNPRASAAYTDSRSVNDSDPNIGFRVVVVLNPADVQPADLSD